MKQVENRHLTDVWAVLVQGHGRIIAPDFCVAHREANSGSSTLNRTKSILSIYHQQRQLQKQRGMCLNDTYPFCQQPLSGNCHNICFSKPVLWAATPVRLFCVKDKLWVFVLDFPGKRHTFPCNVCRERGLNALTSFQNGCACHQSRIWAWALPFSRSWGRYSTYTAGRGSCRCTSCGACWRACRSAVQSPYRR